MNAKLNLPRLEKYFTDQYSEILGSKECQQLYSSIANQLYVKFGSAPHSFVMSSARKGDGKTLITLLLSMYSFTSIAGRTLLIDSTRSRDAVRACNVSISGIESISRFETHQPLTNYIKATGIPGLDICQVYSPDFDLAALPQEQLEVFTKIAKGHYQRIIVDSSAAAETTDYVVLARIFSNVMFVVSHRQTRRQQVKAQLESLVDTDCEVLGTILNRRKFPIPSRIYK